MDDMIRGLPDESGWRIESGGPPFDVAVAFSSWVGRLPEALDDGAKLTTSASWPTWRAHALDGSLQRAFREIHHFASHTRYPADGMAHVLLPVVHPDQDEILVVEQPTLAWVHIVTLLLEDGSWRVHSITSTFPPPEELGRVAYPAPGGGR